MRKSVFRKSASIISFFLSRRRLSVGEDPGAAEGQHPAQQGHPGTGKIFSSTVDRNYSKVYSYNWAGIWVAIIQ